MSVLEKSSFKDQDRPYSQNELKYKRQRLFYSLRLGKIKACHSKCDHFYFVKQNGRKEKDIIENKSNDSGNCSVCWKYNKTPRYLKNKARELINYYNDVFSFNDEYTYFNYEDNELESIFYTWLYEEIN